MKDLHRKHQVTCAGIQSDIALWCQTANLTHQYVTRDACDAAVIYRHGLWWWLKHSCGWKVAQIAMACHRTEGLIYGGIAEAEWFIEAYLSTNEPQHYEKLKQMQIVQTLLDNERFTPVEYVRHAARKVG